MPDILYGTAAVNAPAARPGPAGPLPGSGRARARRRARLLGDVTGVAPAVALYTFLLVAPAVVALLLSFFSWNGVSGFRWAGLANWSRLFSDSGAASSLILTLVVTAVSWLLQTVISMAAGLTTARPTRTNTALSVLYVVPLLVSTAGIGLIWEALLAPSLGGVAYLSATFHLHFLATNWLGDPSIVLYVITGIVAWQLVPFYTLLYRTARQQIPRTLYEAAAIDGATGAQAFRHVTLPQLRNTIASSSVLIVISTLTYFDMFFLLTDGGPGTSSRVLSLYMYNEAFSSTDFGYASVLTVVLVLIGISAGAALLKAARFSSSARMAAGGE
jgi:ABC-type sugar transport system permease subunit